MTGEGSRPPWAAPEHGGETPAPEARLSDIDRHRRAEAVFLEVAGRTPAERAALLDERCAGDAGLRDEVQSLLDAHDEGGGLLDSAVFASPGAGASSRADSLRTDALPHGRRIGAYTALGVLGSGGMGVVYVAEQERPRRTVALKVIRPGLATPQVLRRFELEAETLGRLHHPGIAQIYEAGTADTGLGPQPFFAMELVKGKSLTAHAEERGLDHRARLALVALVCDAVQHAHQRGVIHRDLKPGNILVDEAGQPKVLDFGVSRAVSGEAGPTTIETNLGQLIGTLPYMSPEQVSGSPDEVDTRSDVYALGVVAYQLLTGRLPHDVSGRSLPEAARMIQDEAPARLSGLSRVYRGEVDTIVATALEKDKSRRYQTAAAFAEDIRRYLSGEPIAARRDSAMYVLRKQVRKHRVAAGAALALMAILVVFAVVSAVQAGANGRLARRERTARLEADRARDIAREEQTRADAESERLRRGLYFSRIGFAQAANASHDTPSMRALLAECPPDLRNWEWSYLSDLVDDSERTTEIYPGGRGALVGSSLLSTDAASTTLLTLDSTKRLRVWSIASGVEQRGFDVPGAALGLALAPAGDVAYCLVSQDGVCEARAIDARTGETCWATSIPPEALGRCALSADGSTLGVIGLSGAHVALDARTGAEISRTDPATAVTTIAGAISPDGRRIAAAEWYGQVGVWDTSDGARVGAVLAHKGLARAVAFSPDGQSLASGGSDGVVRVWSLPDLRETLTIRAHDNKVWALAWRPDGLAIASCGTDTTIVVTSVPSGERLGVLHGHAVTVSSLEFTRDGRWLISSSRDAIVKWWAMPPSPVVKAIDIGSRTAMVAVGARAGVFAIGTGKGEVLVFDSTTARERWRARAHSAETWGGGFSPDGATLYTAGDDGVVRAWDARSGEPGPERALDAGRVLRLAIAPDGRLAAACNDGSVFVLAPGLSGEALRIRANKGFSAAVAWSPDGSRLATGGEDAVVRVWNGLDGALLAEFRGHSGHIYSAAWGAEGRTLFTASEDWTIRRWGIDPSFEPLVLSSHGGPVYTLQMNSRGDRLISGSFDNNVKVWDPGTGQDILTLRGHIMSTAGVAFGPGDRWILSGNDDGFVRLWGFPRERRLDTTTPIDRGTRQ